MKFVSVRELRLKPADVWKLAKRERNVILTSNGRPIAILTGVDDETFEAELDVIERARALRALDRIQRESVRKGTDKMTQRQIEEEIAAARRGRQK
jgi:prevent-host-death family protein